MCSIAWGDLGKCWSNETCATAYLFLLVGTSVKLCPSIWIEPVTYIYLIASGEISIYPKWLNWYFHKWKNIFSQMKYNKSILFSLLVSNYDIAILIVSPTDTDPTSFFFCFFFLFLSFFIFFLTSLFLNKTSKCRYAFSMFLSKTIKCRFAFPWL